MDTNLSTLDRYVRLVGGIALVTSALSMRRSLMKQAVMAVGAMKITEGTIGWCPLMHLVGVRDNKTAVHLGSPSANQPKQSAEPSSSQPNKEGAQMDTHTMERLQNESPGDAMSPIEAQRALEGSDALNTAYQ